MQNIAIPLIVITLSSIFTLGAFSSPQVNKKDENTLENIQKLKIAPDIRKLIARENEEATKWIQFDWGEYSEKNVTENSILYQKLSELSGIFYQHWSKSPSTLTKDKWYTIKLWMGSYVISHYDPFIQTMVETEDFLIKNITNGNIYVEQTGSGYIVFALDSVSEIVFLSKWKQISNYILFPGMWISIDWSRNWELENADSIKISDIHPVSYIDTSTTGLINKNIPNGYRMILTLKKYLQYLSQKSDYFTQWWASIHKNSNYERAWLINNTKIEFLIESDLDFYLQNIPAYIEQNWIDGIKSMRDQINSLYQIAKTKWFNKNIDKTFVQFIEKTRFTIYNKKYQEWYKIIYNTVLGILSWKDIVKAKNLEFYQALSDQYMNEIIHDIDIKEEKPKIIENIINENQDIKHLDMAIYVYSIFDYYNVFNYGMPIQFRWIFILADNLFNTLTRYLNSLNSPQKREESLTIIFDRFLKPTTESFLSGIKNAYFKNENNYSPLILKDEYIDENKMTKINPDTVQNIRNLQKTIANFMEKTKSISSIDGNSIIEEQRVIIDWYNNELIKIISIMVNYRDYYLCEVVWTGCNKDGTEEVIGSGNTNTWSSKSMGIVQLKEYLSQFKWVDINTLRLNNENPENDWYYNVSISINNSQFQFNLTEEDHTISNIRYEKGWQIDESLSNIIISLDQKQEEQNKINKNIFSEFFLVTFFWKSVIPEKVVIDKTDEKNKNDSLIDPEIVIFKNNLINEDFSTIKESLEIEFDDIDITRNSEWEYDIVLSDVINEYDYTVPEIGWKTSKENYKVNFTSSYIYKRNYHAFKDITFRFKNNKKTGYYNTIISVEPSSIQLNEILEKTVNLWSYLYIIEKNTNPNGNDKIVIDLNNWQVIINDNTILNINE